MLQIVRHNFGLKLVSLALAVVGWGYFRFANNPVIAARFAQQVSVPIALVNTPPGTLVRYTDKQAVVTVEPKRGEAPVKPEEIKAVLDLSSRAPGIYNVPVQLVAPNVAVQSLSPASVTLTIEKIEQRSLALGVHYVTSAQLNVVVNHLVLSPRVASVRGASSALQALSAVRVDVPIAANAAGRLDVMLRPMAVDAQGVEIPGVQVAPNLVRVQAEFAPASGKGR